MNSIETELKKNGIKITEKLNTLTSNTLAKNVADKISQTFPEQDLNSNELFAKFSRINMYKANIPNGMAEANYFYKNSSVYFRDNTPFEQLEKFAIHEFIHNLQEVKDNKGNLQRLGLCKFNNIKTYGLALNEASVQFASSKVLNNDTDIVKYYEISLPTISSSYYPLICNLIEQLAYLIGEYTLFNSTFYSNDLFEEDCITYLGKKNYIEIQNNFDKILLLEENIIKLNNILISDKCEGINAHRIAKKISDLKAKIRSTYISTQDLIFTSYFDNEFNKLRTTEEVEIYRYKLSNYRNFIGIVEGYYTFDNYYLNKLSALEIKYENILNNTDLITIPDSKTYKIFMKIKKIFSFAKEQI